MTRYYQATAASNVQYFMTSDNLTTAHGC